MLCHAHAFTDTHKNTLRFSFLKGITQDIKVYSVCPLFHSLLGHVLNKPQKETLLPEGPKDRRTEDAVSLLTAQTVLLLNAELMLPGAYKRTPIASSWSLLSFHLLLLWLPTSGLTAAVAVVSALYFY